MRDLKSIRYIELPGNIISDTDIIDRSIKVPVRIPNGKKKLTEDDISLSAIVSAMIEIIAWNENDKNVPYYKNFVTATDNGIAKKLNTAAIAKREQRDYEFAEELSLAVYHLVPQSASCVNLYSLYLLMAGDAIEKGNEDLADEYYHKAKYTLLDGIGRFGENEDILAELSVYEGNMGNAEEALRYIDRYLSVAAEGEKKEAIKSYKEKLILCMKSDEEIKSAYDFIYMGENERAIERMNSFIERNDKIWHAYFLRGWAYRKEERFDDARKDFLKCLELGEGIPEIYNELSLCELGNGSRDLAKVYLETAADLDPDNITVVSNLAFLYLEDGDFDMARKNLEKARFLAPSDSVVKTLIGDYERETGEKIGEIIHEESVKMDDVPEKHEHCECGHHHGPGHNCSCHGHCEHHEEHT